MGSRGDAVRSTTPGRPGGREYRPFICATWCPPQESQGRTPTVSCGTCLSASWTGRRHVPVPRGHGVPNREGGCADQCSGSVPSRTPSPIRKIACRSPRTLHADVTWRVCMSIYFPNLQAASAASSLPIFMQCLTRVDLLLRSHV